jgi:hypothetical protein
MKQISFVIIIILLAVILFSIFKYSRDEPIFENMSQGRFMVIASIVNDETGTTSDLEKVNMLNNLNISDEKIKVILDSTKDSNEKKILRIKDVIKIITL